MTVAIALSGALAAGEALTGHVSAFADGAAGKTLVGTAHALAIGGQALVASHTFADGAGAAGKVLAGSAVDALATGQALVAGHGAAVADGALGIVLAGSAAHGFATNAAAHALATNAAAHVLATDAAGHALAAGAAGPGLVAVTAGHSLLDVVLLGIVEGVTEFLPVSSTGHLILATKLLGFDPDSWALFNIVIQLGAILAIVVLYWRTLIAVGSGLVRRDPVSLRFARNVLLAFVPAVAVGLAVHRQVEALLGHAEVVAVALIAGGIAILLIERTTRRVTVNGVAAMPAGTALAIGLVQCLAMIPGVSRSGATIMGALAFGVERRTAAEFSFFLAIPTMLGATTLELVKNRALLDAAELHDIAIGFVVAFVVALVVVRAFVRVISRYGFAPFAWYRIVVGSVALVWLYAL